jgi:hypothetical protein
MSRTLQFALHLNRLAIDLGDAIDADRAERVGRLLSEELTDEEFLTACRQVLIKETRFPPPAKFLEYGKGTMHERAEVAIGKAFEARARFGVNQRSNARAFLGEETWTVIESMGGWWLFCRDDLNVTAYRAQFLNSSKSREESKTRCDVKALIGQAAPEALKLAAGLADQKKMPLPPTKKLPQGGRND